MKRVIVSDPSLQELTGITADTSNRKAGLLLAEVLRRDARARGESPAPAKFESGCRKFVEGEPGWASASHGEFVVEALALNDDLFLFCHGRTSQIDAAPLHPRERTLRRVGPGQSPDEFEHDLKSMTSVTTRELGEPAIPIDELRTDLQNRVEFAWAADNDRYVDQIGAFVILRCLTEHGIEAIESGRADSRNDLAAGRRPPRVSEPPGGDMMQSPGLYVSMIFDPHGSKSLFRQLLDMLNGYTGRVFAKPSTEPGKRFCSKRGVRVADSSVWELDLPRLTARRG